MGAKGLLRTNEKKKEGFVEEVIGMGFVRADGCVGSRSSFWISQASEWAYGMTVF